MSQESQYPGDIDNYITHMANQKTTIYGLKDITKIIIYLFLRVRYCKENHEAYTG